MLLILRKRYYYHFQNACFMHESVCWGWRGVCMLIATLHDPSHILKSWDPKVDWGTWHHLSFAWLCLAHWGAVHSSCPAIVFCMIVARQGSGLLYTTMLTLIWFCLHSSAPCIALYQHMYQHSVGSLGWGTWPCITVLWIAFAPAISGQSGALLSMSLPLPDKFAWLLLTVHTISACFWHHIPPCIA